MAKAGPALPSCRQARLSNESGLLEAECPKVVVAHLGRLERRDVRLVVLDDEFLRSMRLEDGRKVDHSGSEVSETTRGVAVLHVVLEDLLRSLLDGVDSKLDGIFRTHANAGCHCPVKVNL